MIKAAAEIKTDGNVLLTDAGKRSQKCFCRGGIRCFLRVPGCKNDGISVLTVFLNRVRVLQAREEPALKLTGFKNAVPALTHPSAVATAEAFMGFRDLLDLIACKQQPAPIWEIQNRPVPLCNLAPMRVKFIGLGRATADKRDKSIANRNKCLIVINSLLIFLCSPFLFEFESGTEKLCAAQLICGLIMPLPLLHRGLPQSDFAYSQRISASIDSFLRGSR